MTWLPCCAENEPHCPPRTVGSRVVQPTSVPSGSDRNSLDLGTKKGKWKKKSSKNKPSASQSANQNEQKDSDSLAVSVDHAEDDGHGAVPNASPPQREGHKQEDNCLNDVTAEDCVVLEDGVHKHPGFVVKDYVAACAIGDVLRRKAFEERSKATKYKRKANVAATKKEYFRFMELANKSFTRMHRYHNQAADAIFLYLNQGQYVPELALKAANGEAVVVDLHHLFETEVDYYVRWFVEEYRLRQKAGHKVYFLTGVGKHTSERKSPKLTKALKTILSRPPVDLPHAEVRPGMLAATLSERPDLAEIILEQLGAAKIKM